VNIADEHSPKNDFINHLDGVRAPACKLEASFDDVNAPKITKVSEHGTDLSVEVVLQRPQTVQTMASSARAMNKTRQLQLSNRLDSATYSDTE
jgi:hypothetical protein